MDAGIVELLRSLGFGGLFGAGLLGLLYVLFSGHFSAGVSLRDVLVVGGLLGAGLHRIIDRYFVESLLRPITGFLGYYSRLAQLEFLRRSGLIGQRHADQLLRALTDRYFLDTPQQQRPRQLPPPAE